MFSPFQLIGGVFGLGTDRVARVIVQALGGGAGPPGRVVAIGMGLGRALARRGMPVVVVSPAGARGGKRSKQVLPEVVARAAALPLATGAVDAVCLAGMPGEGLEALRECARVVRPGGLVALAATTSALQRKVAPPEVMAALMVHAALVDVEQHQVGATWLTAGRVMAWR